MPNVLGVNPQTSHRVLKLTLSIPVYSEADNVPKIQKFRFGTYKALEHIRNCVSSRITDLIDIRKITNPSIITTFFKDYILLLSMII